MSILSDPDTGWAGQFKQALFRSQQRADELGSQPILMTKKAEQAENERDRLTKCFSQIEICMAKYRIPEEE